MTTLDDLKGFDLAAASVSLWVFKGPTGTVGTPPHYTGRWVETTDAVDAVLKETFDVERNRIEEIVDYSLLAQNHETSALSISIDETHAGLLIGHVAAETEQKRVAGLDQMRNSTFYVIKLLHGDTLIYAIRKTDGAWKTRKAISMRSVFYEENRLTIDDRPHFDISNTIDFFLVGGDVLILNKDRFESVLRYKGAHKDDFLALQAEEAFTSIFVDLAPLVAHVGENKIQLRRAAAIHQKGHYRDAEFMGRLRELHANYGFTIQFDGAGKIVPTPETCAQIITALLDHRLSSAFSAQVYDVPSATPIAM